MNPETRNLVSAICLSMAVLIGYQMLFGEKPSSDLSNQSVSNDTQTSKGINESSIDLPNEIEKQNNGSQYFLSGILNFQNGTKHIKTTNILKLPIKSGGTFSLKITF